MIASFFLEPDGLADRASISLTLVGSSYRTLSYPCLLQPLQPSTLCFLFSFQGADIIGVSILCSPVSPSSTLQHLAGMVRPQIRGNPLVVQSLNTFSPALPRFVNLNFIMLIIGFIENFVAYLYYIKVYQADAYAR